MSKKKKKILFVVNVDWFFLSHRLPLALEAKRSGYTVYIAAADTGKAKDVKSYGLHFIDVQFLKSSETIFKEILVVHKLRKLYRKINPILIHHVTIRPVLYGSIAARAEKIPAVLNALSGLGYVYINNTFKNKIARIIFDQLFKWGFNHPNNILVLQNPDDVQVILARKIISITKIRIIPGSGVDTDLYKPKPNRSSDKEAIRIALIGRMLFDKGITEFVEAARICNSNEINATFHLYGAPYDNNPMSVSNRQLAMWNKEGNVQVHGYVDNIPEILNQLDIVCLPSYREGLPKSLIEASSAGLPVIATNVPGCREAVLDGISGYLVEMKNSASLAQRIEELANDPKKRKAFGIKGRELVIKKFSLQIIIKKTMECYCYLLENVSQKTHSE